MTLECRAIVVFAALFITSCEPAAQPSPSNAVRPGVSSSAVMPSAGVPSRLTGPACPSGPVFTVLPLDPTDFRAFRPLGFPAPPIHIFGAKHSAFIINLPGQPAVSGRPVRFPSDATVTDVVSTESAAGSGYQVTFAPCRDLKSYLFHLGTIAPTLEKAFKTSIQTCQDFDFGAAGGRTRKCGARLSLAAKAGDPVGGSDAFAGVDWGVVDYRVTLPYANPRRYDGDYPHIGSPVDYAAPDVRAQLEAKLGSIDGRVRRTADPKAGTIMQDVPGTAQGNWFTADANFMNTTDFSPFLGLLHDFVDPDVPIISMGTSVRGMTSGVYTFAPRSTGLINRDFRDVRPDGQMYCYEQFQGGVTRSGLNLASANGVLVMTMPTPTSLRVELQVGPTCASTRMPGATAFTFDR